MTSEEILGNLCIRDPRNPDHKDHYMDFYDYEIGTARKNCFCENCFNGRDILALEIIKLKEEL